jgi:hypothetical protein
MDEILEQRAELMTLLLGVSTPFKDPFIPHEGQSIFASQIEKLVDHNSKNIPTSEMASIIDRDAKDIVVLDEVESEQASDVDDQITSMQQNGKARKDDAYSEQFPKTEIAVTEILKYVSVFDQFKPEDKQIIAESSRIEDFSPGTTIVRAKKGDRLDAIHLVLSGIICLSTSFEKDCVQLLPGDTFWPPGVLTATDSMRFTALTLSEVIIVPLHLLVDKEIIPFLNAPEINGEGPSLQEEHTFNQAVRTYQDFFEDFRIPNSSYTQEENGRTFLLKVITAFGTEKCVGSIIHEVLSLCEEAFDVSAAHFISLPPQQENMTVYGNGSSFFLPRAGFPAFVASREISCLNLSSGITSHAHYDCDIESALDFSARQLLCSPVLMTHHDGVERAGAALQLVNTRKNVAFGRNEEIMMKFVVNVLSSLMLSTYSAELFSQLTPVTEVSNSFEVTILDATVRCEDKPHKHLKCKIEMFVGEKRFGKPFMSKLVGTKASANGNEFNRKCAFNQRARYPNLLVQDVPISLKLFFSLYTRNNHPMGWAALNISDSRKHMRNGRVELRLFRGEYSDPYMTDLQCKAHENGEMVLRVALGNMWLRESPLMFVSNGKRQDDSYELLVDPDTPFNAPGLEERFLQLTSATFEANMNYGKRDVDLLWSLRHKIAKSERGYSRYFFGALDWFNRKIVDEAHYLLKQHWIPFSIGEALQLLGPEFSDPLLRSRAVESLRPVPDELFLGIVPFLVQLLRYGPFFDSALSRLLLFRACTNLDEIGFSLGWQLLSEIKAGRPCRRHIVLLKSLLSMDEVFTRDFFTQTKGVERLAHVSNVAWGERGKSRMKCLWVKLNRMSWKPCKLPVGIDSKTLLPDRALVNSTQSMTKFIFETGNNELRSMIIYGDTDLRVAKVIADVTRVFNYLLNKELPQLTRWTGILFQQYVPVDGKVTLLGEYTEKISLNLITKQGNGPELLQWIIDKAQNDDKKISQMRSVFLFSTAYYGVVHYILGLRGITEKEVFLDHNGRLFIQAANSFLGNEDGFVSDSLSPLTHNSIVRVITGNNMCPDMIDTYESTALSVFRVLRENTELLVGMLRAMLPWHLTGLQNPLDLSFVYNKLGHGLSNEDAERKFLDFAFHY